MHQIENLLGFNASIAQNRVLGFVLNIEQEPQTTIDMYPELSAPTACW